MQDAGAGDGGDEDDGATAVVAVVFYHVAGAGLGDEEGTCEVDVEEMAELVGGVGFGFDVGAK